MGFLDRFFKKRETSTSQVAMVREQSGGFTVWSGDAYANDTYRAAVHSIAINFSKMRGTHVINHADHRDVLGDCRLTKLLSHRPNAIMSAADFYYKIVTQLYLKNNAFALLDRNDQGDVIGVYPVDYTNVEMLTDEQNNLYSKFTLYTGRTVIFPYSDIIHLRRNYCDGQFFGESNGALYPALELAHHANESVVNGLKSSAGIRGLLKFTSILPDDVKKEQRQSFIDEFLSFKNDGGIVVMDNKAEFIPIESKPVLLSSEQQEAIQEKIYSYLNISKEIVTSSYDENKWGAFHESVIEPLAVMMSQEFTEKCFSDRQRKFGNQIVFETAGLAFMSNQSKINMLKELVPLGLLSVNDCMTILNLPSVPDGDRRIMSLNYADQSIISEYQLGKVKGKGVE